MNVNAMHAAMPAAVGTRMERSIHLKLPVSLRMVRQVVAQGQCISENSMVLIAVTQVHPFWDSSVHIAWLSPSSSRLPWAR